MYLVAVLLNDFKLICVSKLYDFTTATCRVMQFLHAVPTVIYRGLRIKGGKGTPPVRDVCVCARWEESVRALPHLFRLTESVARSDLLMDMERERATRRREERKMGGRVKSRQHFNCFLEKKKRKSLR